MNSMRRNAAKMDLGAADVETPSNESIPLREHPPTYPAMRNLWAGYFAIRQTIRHAGASDYLPTMRE